MNEPTNISCISAADCVQCTHMFHTMFLDADSIHPPTPPLLFFSKFPFLLAKNYTNFLSTLTCFAKVFWKWCMMLSVISYSQPCSLLFTFFFHWFFPHRAEDVFPLVMLETSVMAEFLFFFFFFWKRNYTASETYQLSWRRGRTLLKHWIETLKLWHSI